METQSTILKNLHAALDELEMLVIEGENLDLDVVEALMAKVEKLKQTIQEKNNK